MIIYPFNIILPPLLSQYYDENKIERVRIFLKYSLKYFLAFAIPSLVGLSLLSRIIIQILSTSEIASNGYIVTPFITFSALLYGIYSMHTYILILNKKTKIIGILWFIAAISNILLNFILIPSYGILGAALSTLISYTIASVISVLYSSKYFRIDFELSFIGKCLFATAAMSLIIVKFYPTRILNLLVVIVACALVYIALLILLKGFKKEEIDFMKNIVKK
jgi:O-antigen/teichoic acid export membrane protein